jgi:hypothetical protein
METIEGKDFTQDEKKNSMKMAVFWDVVPCCLVEVY